MVNTVEAECPIKDCDIYCEGDQRNCPWVDHGTWTDCEYFQKIEGEKKKYETQKC
jgi:hypothetical protein